MVLVGGASVMHDVAVLAVVGYPAGVVATAALMAMALAVMLVAVAAPLAVLATWAFQRWRWMQLALPAVTMGGLSWWLLDPTRRLSFGVYATLVAATSVVAVVVVWLAGRPAGWNRACAALVAIGAWLVDHWVLSPTTYIELHNLAEVLWIVAVLAVGSELRRRWERDPRWHREIAATAALIASVLAMLMVDELSPRWRIAASEHALAVNGYMRAARALVDLDRDGYSPIAWGGDCDDFDDERNPRAVDAPGGGDANCNGVDPPVTPTEADRGFTAAFGDPSGPGALVILISVDTLRADALHPELMPRTWAYAGRGLRFDQMYATSPSTFTSLPFLVRAGDLYPPVADELRRRAGVNSTTIYDGVTIDRRALGFSHAVGVSYARGVTDAALAHLEAIGANREFLWLHYFDPHQPYRVPESTRIPQALEHLPAEYRRVVAYTDRWLGELFDGLDRLGLSSRAVVLFTADHGEAFGEYGEHQHGRTAYEAVLRVPAFIVAPGIEPGVYAHLASHRDIVPTVLGASGLDPPELFGRSWLRLRGDPTRPLHEQVFSRSTRFASGREVDVPLGVVVQAHQKLVVELESDLAVLHDLRVAGGEAIDLAPAYPDLVAELRRLLALHDDLDAFPAVMHRP
jgi:hypothetical protein